MENKTLSLNAELKWIEHVLGVFDEADEALTLKEVRNEFYKKFSIKKPFPLLNSDFGIIRSLPLMFIKEIEQRNPDKNKDYKTIQIIRNAISHLQYDYDAKGYSFKSKQGAVEMSYDEFNKLLYRIENEFHNKERPI